MEAGGLNMKDVRMCLGVKNIIWKIEKRVLERIGYAVRMEINRMTKDKAMVFGWFE